MALPKLFKIIVYYPKFQVIFDNFGVIVYNFCFTNFRSGFRNRVQRYYKNAFFPYFASIIGS